MLLVLGLPLVALKGQRQLALTMNYKYYGQASILAVKQV